MENATKALLIAAAVLIAIIIISFGLTVVRQGQQSVQDADLSEAEVTTFNSKFTVFEGTNKSTSNVNAMLDAVLGHNNNEKASGKGNYVKVDLKTKETTKTLIAKEAVSSVEKLSGNNYYNVQCTYVNGIVDTITITGIGTNAPAGN